MAGPNDLTGKYPSVTYQNILQQVDEPSSRNSNVYNGLGETAYILPMVFKNEDTFDGTANTITVEIPSGCLKGWFFVTYKCLLVEDAANNAEAAMTLEIIRVRDTTITTQSTTKYILRNVLFAGNVYAETRQMFQISPGDIIRCRITENVPGWDAKDHFLIIQRCHNLNPPS
jgi:hypothetical protein